MRNRMLFATAMLLAVCPVLCPPRAKATGEQSKMMTARIAERQGDQARERKEYPAAQWYYKKAAENDPRNPAVYNKLGIMQVQNNDYRGAQNSFRHAAKLAPQSPNAFNNLGALFCLEKKYKPAIDNLKRALALDETLASAHMNIAEAWLGRGDGDRAMTEYARAIELDPDILDSSRAGVIAQVATPEQRAWVNFLIAKAYARRGNIENALDFLQRAKEEHFPNMHKVYDERDFATLWPDPRLEQIVKR